MEGSEPTYCTYPIHVGAKQKICELLTLVIKHAAEMGLNCYRESICFQPEC